MLCNHGCTLEVRRTTPSMASVLTMPIHTASSKRSNQQILVGTMICNDRWSSTLDQGTHVMRVQELIAAYQDAVRQAIACRYPLQHTATECFLLLLPLFPFVLPKFSALFLCQEPTPKDNALMFLYAIPVYLSARVDVK